MVVEIMVSGGDGGFEYEAVMTEVRVWVRTLVTRVVPSARVESDTLLWVCTGSVDSEVKIGMMVDDEGAVVAAWEELEEAGVTVLEVVDEVGTLDDEMYEVGIAAVSVAALEKLSLEIGGRAYPLDDEILKDVGTESVLVEAWLVSSEGRV